ncbi:MAG: hypothetical protein E6R13_02695 [Spirochaetes bacterium]|nr:MAG: hypothetical protein E6R13_02695 [Spirochaetota bacterium]
MNFNYIGIDTSLSSTGLYIILKDGTEFYYNYRNTDKLTKWHKTLDYVTYKDYENIKVDNYSDTEVAKIIQYNKITNMIVHDILQHCVPEETVIVTEGYSFSSSNTSSLIDLICYATLLRNKLISMTFNNFIIKAPSTLKLETCSLTYKPIVKEIGGKNPRKEYIYKNDEGIAGGKFTKREMLKSAFDNKKLNIRITKTLLFVKSELLKMKMIPKPIDDLMDGVWLAWSEILQKEV